MLCLLTAVVSVALSVGVAGECLTKVTPAAIDGLEAHSSDTEAQAAWDGNADTYYQAKEDNGAWTTSTFPTPRQIGLIRYLPRVGYSHRMVRGRFVGIGATEIELGEVAVKPSELTWNEIKVTDTSFFTGLKYIGPTNSQATVAEIEVEVRPSNLYRLMYSGSVCSDASRLPLPCGECVGTGLNDCQTLCDNVPECTHITVKDSATPGDRWCRAFSGCSVRAPGTTEAIYDKRSPCTPTPTLPTPTSTLPTPTPTLPTRTATLPTQTTTLPTRTATLPTPTPTRTPTPRPTTPTKTSSAKLRTSTLTPPPPNSPTQTAVAAPVKGYPTKTPVVEGGRERDDVLEVYFPILMIVLIIGGCALWWICHHMAKEKRRQEYMAPPPSEAELLAISIGLGRGRKAPSHEVHLEEHLLSEHPSPESAAEVTYSAVSKMGSDVESLAPGSEAFPVGTDVVVHGHEAEPSLNGKQGTVTAIISNRSGAGVLVSFGPTIGSRILGTGVVTPADRYVPPSLSSEHPLAAPTSRPIIGMDGECDPDSGSEMTVAATSRGDTTPRRSTWGTFPDTVSSSPGRRTTREWQWANILGRWETSDGMQVTVKGRHATVGGESFPIMESEGMPLLDGCQIVAPSSTENTLVWDDGQIWYRCDSLPSRTSRRRRSRGANSEDSLTSLLAKVDRTRRESIDEPVYYIPRGAERGAGVHGPHQPAILHRL